MPGESFLQNSTVIIIAVVAIIIIALGLFLFLRQRRNKRADELRVRSELIAMERENQFAAAADHVPYSRDPRAIATEMAAMFREYLGVPVLAVYAGREDEDQLANLLAEAESSRDMPMPGSISAASAREYSRPQVAMLSEIAGAGSVDNAVEQVDQPAHVEDSKVATTAPLDEAAPGDSRPASQPGPQSGRKNFAALVMPWRGPFNWNGVVVTQAQEQISPESLARFGEPLGRLSDRLAVALEFQREHSEALALDERASRTLGFSRSLISCLEDAAPLASITREVTKLLDADSAALWRVEPGASMVRMVAAFGLRSAEFLPLPIGQGLAGSVAQSGESLALEDAPSDPRCIFPREARESGIGSYLGVPIFVGDHAIGVVEVHTARHRKWTESDQRTLRSAALIISEILRNTDVRGKRLRVESAYLGLSEALQRLRAPGEVMDAVVEVLGHALAVSRALVVQFDDAG
ncbi:MAG TPA: GAF domain-containing protein, partial [Blastocatellia bacterium]